jgi:hypothetical protein
MNTLIAIGLIAAGSDAARQLLQGGGPRRRPPRFTG